MPRLALFLLLLLSLPVRANLGESIAQCVARYGKPVGYTEANAKNPFGTVVYVAGGYTLVIFVLNDQEVGARVAKQDKSAFTDAERQNIMAADVAGDKWTAQPCSDPTCLEWTRGDKATVFYDKDKHILIFTSAAMAQAVRTKP